MRQIMKLFITSFLFILFSGCTKDVYDPSDKIPGEGTNPFSKVTISSNFDWSMIQISHLTVQSFDPYDGTYNYLVEVFDKSPEDQDANLLATGVCSKKTLFDKKIIYPKGESDQVYIQLTTPTGYQVTAPVTLTPGNDNVCAFDSLVQMKTSMKDDYVQFANIKLTFRALGGTKRAGAFIHLPGIKSKDIQKAELNGWTTTPESETETPVYALSDDIHGLFSFHEMINTDNDLPYRGKQERLITFSFAAGALKDLTIDDIDLFTTVLKREGEVLRTEIHQRNYSYTPKGVRYRYYSNDNCIWALMIPDDFKYPVEHAFIGDAYPDLLKWVSGDSKHVQWYKSKNTVDKWIYTREQ